MMILLCVQKNGKNYFCCISNIDKNSVIARILKEDVIDTEMKNHITIFQGLPKVDKMEYIIQKCTELGVKEFYPVKLNRCIVKLDEKGERGKVERWSKIVEAATKQSNRNYIPVINSVINLENILEIMKDYDILLVPYENEKEKNLKSVLKEFENKEKKEIKIGIVIGPEGGFEESEIEVLRKAGGKVVTLGSRILRTETVAIFMTSILSYELDEI